MIKNDNHLNNNCLSQVYSSCSVISIDNLKISQAHFPFMKSSKVRNGKQTLAGLLSHYISSKLPVRKSRDHKNILKLQEILEVFNFSLHG